MANVIGGAFSAFPVAGSVSRSAVNSDSDAKSRTAGLVAAALVGLTLTCLTPVFEHLPLFALAAIVISGVLVWLGGLSRNRAPLQDQSP